MAPEFQPWINRIDPNYGLLASPDSDTFGVSLEIYSQSQGFFLMTLRF
jgi:hypothetical protein